MTNEELTVVKRVYREIGVPLGMAPMVEAVVRLTIKAARNAALEQAAELADRHSGEAGRIRLSKGFAFKRMSRDAQEEISAEERGEDIAAEIIAAAIRALKEG